MKIRPYDIDETGYLHILARAYLVLVTAAVLLIGANFVLGQVSDGFPHVAAALPDGANTVDPKPKPPSARQQTVALIGRLSSPSRAAAAPHASPAAGSVSAPLVKPLYAGAALVADPALIEQTAMGPLPRIADDGRSPMTAYAATDPAAGTHKPKIALVITGLGVSSKMTTAVLAEMPPTITLAIMPYGANAQAWINEARKRGHEILLQVPMEPYDFPDSDPGPHMLRADDSESANLERLTWSMTRMTGYVGVTNLFGDRFLAEQRPVESVLSFLSRRGLLFVHTCGRTAAAELHTGATIKVLETGAIIDSIPAAADIDSRLSELETRARRTGAAVGAASPYPITLERVAAWAKGLSGRGFVLVPASAIAAASK